MVKTYFNLEDPIVGDSLDAISLMDLVSPVVGGLAVQIHAHELRKALRNTPDVDLITHENMDFSQFDVGVYKNIRPVLLKLGYHVQPKKGRNNNAVKVIKNPNKPAAQNFLLNYTFFSSNLYPKFVDYIGRQIEFAKKVNYSSSRKEILVASLEEVIPLKLQRATRYGTEREALVGPVYHALIENAKRSNWGSLAGMPLHEWSVAIDKMQKDVGTEQGPFALEKVETYKLSKDIYDICLASRVISDDITTFDKDRYELNIHRIFDRSTGSVAA